MERNGVKQLYLIHAGVGKVGKEVIRQISIAEKRLRLKYSIQFLYTGLFTSHTGLASSDGGIPASLALDKVKNNKLTEGVETPPRSMRVIERTRPPKCVATAVWASSWSAMCM